MYVTAASQDERKICSARSTNTADCCFTLYNPETAKTWISKMPQISFTHICVRLYSAALALSLSLIHLHHAPPFVALWTTCACAVNLCDRAAWVILYTVISSIRYIAYKQTHTTHIHTITSAYYDSRQDKTDTLCLCVLRSKKHWCLSSSALRLFVVFFVVRIIGTDMSNGSERAKTRGETKRQTQKWIQIRPLIRHNLDWMEYFFFVVARANERMTKMEHEIHIDLHSPSSLWLSLSRWIGSGHVICAILLWLIH